MKKAISWILSILISLSFIIGVNPVMKVEAGSGNIVVTSHNIADQHSADQSLKISWTVSNTKTTKCHFTAKILAEGPSGLDVTAPQTTIADIVVAQEVSVSKMKASATILASKLKNYAGKWLKIYIDGYDSSGKGTGEIGGCYIMLLPSDNREVDFSKTSLSFSAAGGSQRLYTVSNTDWKLSTTDKWITVSPKSGNGEEIIKVEVSANTSTSERTGYVSITTPDGKFSEDLKIVQSGRGAELEPLDLLAPDLKTSLTKVSNGMYYAYTEDYDYHTHGLYYEFPPDYDSYTVFVKVLDSLPNPNSDDEKGVLLVEGTDYQTELDKYGLDIDISDTQLSHYAGKYLKVWVKGVNNDKTESAGCSFYTKIISHDIVSTVNYKVSEITMGDSAKLKGRLYSEGSAIAKIMVSIFQKGDHTIGGQLLSTPKTFTNPTYEYNLSSLKSSTGGDLIVTGETYGNLTLTPGEYDIVLYVTLENGKGLDTPPVATLTVLPDPNEAYVSSFTIAAQTSNKYMDETLTFTVNAANCDEVRFYALHGANNSEKTLLETTKLSSTKYTYSKGFTNAGLRTIKAVPIKNGVEIENGSTTQTITIKSRGTVGKPEITTVNPTVAQGESFKLSWKAPTAISGRTISYNVYIYINGESVLLTTNAVTATSFTIPSSVLQRLTPDEPYAVEVHAMASGYEASHDGTNITVINANVPKVISVTPTTGIKKETDFELSVTTTAVADRVKVYVDSYLVAEINTGKQSGSNKVFTTTLAIQNPGSRTLKVIAYSGNNESEAFTKTITVEDIQLPKLQPVSFSSPTDNAVFTQINGGFTVAWAKPSNVSSADRYIVKIWSEKSQKYVYNNTTFECKLTVGSYYLQDIGSYTISVTAIKNGYQSSEATRSFSIKSSQVNSLQKPAITSPSNYGRYNAGESITFSWGNVGGAASYSYAINDITDGEPGSSIMSGTTQNMNVTIAGNKLLAGHTLRFSVSAHSSNASSDYAFTYIYVVPSEKSISVSEDLLSFDSAAASKTLSLSSTGRWTATVVSGKDWITLGSTSGTGNASVKVSVNKNTAQNPRMGLIRFTDSTGVIQIQITQATSAKAYLEVSTSDIVISASRGISSQIAIDSNISWIVRSDSDWLSYSTSGGTYSDTFNIVVTSNNTLQERKGTITISGSGIVRQVVVTQRGGQAPTISSLQSKYTVELGNDVPLRGVIKASGDGLLNKVTIKCNNAGGTANTVASIDLTRQSTSQFNLADLKFATDNANIFSGAGTYEFVVYVSATNFTVTDNAVATFTVVVNKTVQNAAVVDKGRLKTTSTTVTLKAQITNYGNGKFEKCGFDLYDEKGDYIGTPIDIKSRPTNNTNSFQGTITGLTPNTTYYYCPFIKTSEGVFPPTDNRKLIAFTTEEAVPVTEFDIVMSGGTEKVTSVQAQVGDTVSFGVLLKPSDADVKNVKWSISEPAIATKSIINMVSCAQFSIKSSGNATISVEIENYNGTVLHKTISLTAKKADIVKNVLYWDFTVSELNTIGNVTFSDSMFSGSSFDYNHAIAKFALALTCAATHPVEMLTQEARTRRIATMYSDFGFSNAAYFNYDKPRESEEDSAAHSFAQKEIVVNGTKYLLVTVISRGSGYGGEWVSNGNVGLTGDHHGFSTAANQVYEHLLDYINTECSGYEPSKIKFIISGFSRSAAVSNYVAGLLNKDKRFSKQNIYAYCFATPNNCYDKRDLSENICNIINPADIIPLVPMVDIGFYRNGYDIYLPYSKTANYDYLLSNFEDYFKELTCKREPNDYRENFYFDDQPEAIRCLANIFGDYIGDRTIFYVKYQHLIKNLLSKLSDTMNIQRVIESVIIEFIERNISHLLSRADVLGVTNNDMFAKVEYYISNWEGFVWSAHRAETYVSWMYTLSQDDIKKLESSHCRISVKCPVDVNTYDSSGNRVASISNDQLNESNDASVWCSVKDGAKIVEFDLSEDNMIEIVPRSEGKMTVTVEHIKYDKVTEQFVFEDIVLSCNMEYYIVKMVDDLGVYYVIIDSAQNIVGKAKLVENEVAVVEVNVVGGGFVYGAGEKLSGEYVTLAAIPNDGDAFIGWYRGEELISIENVYSFFADRSETYTAKFTSHIDVIVGDINGDGKVTSKDRIILSRHLDGWEGYESLENPLAADINGDGKVTSKDRIILSRYLDGWGSDYDAYFK